MADNVTLPGTGVVVSADDRSSVFVQRIHNTGSPAINAGQVNISTTAATIIGATTNRIGVQLHNRMARSVFIGEATVTTANGMELLAGGTIYLPTAALIQGITAAASDASEFVHYIEYTE